jgi:hypothetical protein
MGIIESDEISLDYAVSRCNGFCALDLFPVGFISFVDVDAMKLSIVVVLLERLVNLRKHTFRIFKVVRSDLLLCASQFTDCG